MLCLKPVDHGRESLSIVCLPQCSSFFLRVDIFRALCKPALLLALGLLLKLTSFVSQYILIKQFFSMIVLTNRYVYVLVVFLQIIRIFTVM